MKNNRLEPARFIVFDGADGVGKTTQLNAYADELRKKGYSVLVTKALGGNGKDAVQLKCRELLLSPEFPADQTEMEERLFAFSDARNLGDVAKFLSESATNVVIQDRGMPSHIVYCLAKDVAPTLISEYHGELYRLYTDIAWTYGGLNVIMVPEDEKLAMERVIARGAPVVKRLENLDMQRGVIAGMKRFGSTVEAENRVVLQFDAKEDFQNVVLEVTREETIPQVTAKVLSTLKGIGAL